MAVFSNTEITVKILEPAPAGEQGPLYWGMVKQPAAKDVFKVKASSDMKIKDLKAVVAKEKNYPVEAQRFMYFGGELADDRTLLSCGLQNTDDPLLHMIPRV
mmetsp:Transcript_139995/g.348906  ORF Transcript_139995/g.348906 Transcript_139995/m.348906 type:complete len:102 (+) Transcript_139995:113-418(+)